MKVIFINDVAGVAKRSSVRDVANGYALNYLLPRGLAVIATPQKLSALSQQKESAENLQKKQFERAGSLVSQLKGKSIKISAQASSAGTLYAAVTPGAIINAISRQLSMDLKVSQIEMSQHIKNIGKHEVKIILTPQIKVSLVVQVDII